MNVSALDLVGGWPVIDVGTSITVQIDGDLGADTLSSLEQSIGLSWRDGSGCVGEQERYELGGPRHPVSVSIS